MMQSRDEISSNPPLTCSANLRSVEITHVLVLGFLRQYFRNSEAMVMLLLSSAGLILGNLAYNVVEVMLMLDMGESQKK